MVCDNKMLLNGKMVVMLLVECRLILMIVEILSSMKESSGMRRCLLFFEQIREIAGNGLIGANHGQ